MAGPRLYLLILTTGIVAAGLVYYLHIPLPHNITERSKLHVFDMIMRLTYFYPVKLFSYIDSHAMKLSWTRNILKFYAHLLGPWSLSDRDLVIRDTKFDGVGVRVYVPKGKPSSDGAIMFIHGGGFVLMDVQSYDGLTRLIARLANMVTVSIDYRLAPEHLFPAGVEDCERAVIHFLKSAHKNYGVDPRKVAIMGDSAGGNLAAVTSQRLRRHKDLPPLKLQVLLYPVVQYVDFLTPSYQKYYKEYAGTAFLDPESLARWLMMYVGIAPHEERVQHVLNNNHTTLDLRQSPLSYFMRHDHLPDHFVNESIYTVPPSNYGDQQLHAELKPFLLNPDFSPLMNEDFSNLPRGMVMTCEYDILRDEGYWYVKRLRDQGIQVRHVHYDSGFHAMLNFHTEIQLAREAVSDVADFVRNNL